MLTFIQYVKLMKPIGSARSKNAIVMKRMEGNETLQELLNYSSVGKKTAKEIIRLQEKYIKKSYSK